MLQFHMIQKIRTEIIYYLIILVLLALLQHSDLMFSPLERFTKMQLHANYLHPFLYAFIVYSVIGLFRGIAKFILFVKNKF
ncbi:MAG: hypothetical protein FP820_00745 [Sulfurimonas sp.]|nr:hypothetical protein [Sulfurimonas sp.]